MTRHFRHPTGIVYGNHVWSVADGYSLVSAYYDEWYWQPFWITNERPLIVREIVKLRSCAGPALDVGTGTGLYLGELLRLGINSVGIDASQAMIDQAKDRLPASARLVCGSIERLPFASGTFDLLVACRVLSHVADLVTAMQELGRVTSPGGTFIVSDVSAHHDYTTARIPTPEGDVHIETHKHTVEELTLAAEHSGYWRADRTESIVYRDLLWRPQPSEYPAIDTSSARPIFFYGVLTRLG